MTVMNELNKAKNQEIKIQKQTDGKPIAVATVFYGMFIVAYEGYFLSLVAPYISNLSENLIGFALVAVGMFKLIGIIVGNPTIKKVGIYLLAFVWGALAGVSVMYAVGIGYPNPMPIFFVKMVWDCWNVARRGVFE